MVNIDWNAWNASQERQEAWRKLVSDTNQRYKSFCREFLGGPASIRVVTCIYCGKQHIERDNQPEVCNCRTFKVIDPFENVEDGVTGEVMPLCDHIKDVLNGR